MSSHAANSVLTPIQEEKGSLFTRRLLTWNSRKNERKMPWKGEKDPYKIWLSEIILQQTRVEQGMSYYQRFIQSYPTIRQLADAPDNDIFKLWEGLGYYSRCRNLILTAREIASKHNGNFPVDYHDILQLKGIGPYTAAAIASFAYNSAHPVVDGNVFRVYSRIFNCNKPIDTGKGKDYFNRVAQNLLPPKKAALYNQAIMDFGAVICKPLPLCEVCFFKQDCLAYNAGTVLDLPVKEKKVAVRNRYLNYILFRYNNRIAVRQRQQKDIWQHLYEYYLMESEKAASLKQVQMQLHKEIKLPDSIVLNPVSSCVQKLSHQLIHFKIYQVELPTKPVLHDYEWITEKELARLAFPKQLQLLNKQL